tara:strand:+ start:1360 stop:3078 length:1719 start_codon:yes stop_codon:yes gene_type:complete
MTQGGDVDGIQRTIGRYEIQAHIGEGGMAQVYRAFDPQINRTAAMKILKVEHCDDPERRQRFVREGKAAGALAHPHIVTVFDAGEIDGSPFILMELIEGKTLGERLQEGARMSVDQILHLAMQIASALDYAHAKGVVHRDLKPDNIVLSGDGQSAKIADFGIARVETLSEQDSTQVGMMLGTPRYMSPEQANGDRVDGRSDLFTLGVILYEMITGQKAFDAESMPTLIMQITQRDPLPIRQLTRDAPVGLQKIVHKLLQKKPSRRFQSGQELFEALERERGTLREQREESGGYVPLQVKWTAILSTLVAITMGLSAFFVFRAQSNVLTQQAMDAGVSLSKFVAVQAAIPVLGEDWITLDSLVQDAAARDSFSYLMVADHTGVVRVASDPTLVGQPWAPEESAEQVYLQDKVRVTDRGNVFNFNLPVLFNDTVVGEVNMGLDTRPLDAALSVTKRLMLILGFAVVLAVAVAIYIFNKIIAKNLLLATRALKLVGNGQLETRISKQRANEFGDMFSAFNSMADSVEQLLDSAAAAEPGKVPLTPAAPAARDPDISGITRAAVDDVTVVRSPDEQ